MGQSGSKKGKGAALSIEDPEAEQRREAGDMDVPTFPCDYLGFKTLNKPATSVAGLQSPIRELYFYFRKGAQQGIPHARSTLRVTPKGMLMSVVEGGGLVDMFFDVKSFNLVEAVRFAVVNEKKHRVLFQPLAGEARGAAAISDKAAFAVEKPYQFLLQAAGHQPLLVCVLRRPKGVKAIDCHVIAMDNPETVMQVLGLVRYTMNPGAGPPPQLGGAPAGGGAPPGGGSGGSDFNRSGSRGDFIRTEFGDYNVYRGGSSGGGSKQALELRNEHFRGGETPGGYPPPGAQLEPPRQANTRETYPADNADKPRFGWTYDKQPQGGEDFRRGGPPPGPGMALTGGPGYTGDGRYLAQDSRYGNQYPPDPRSQDGRYGNQYPADRKSGEIRDADERVRYRGSGGFGGGGGGAGGPFDGFPPERRNVISHARERSGDSGDGRLSAGRRYETEGGGGPGPYPESWQYSSAGQRQELPATDRPASGGLSPRSSIHQAPVSPRGGSISYDGGSLSPRTPASPSLAPITPTGAPVFSLSNRESRGEVAADDGSGGMGGGGGGGSVQVGKPVAKVPPHMKGVKVLPSDFLAVKLKPKAQRSVSEDSSHDYDNSANITAQYKLLQQQEAQKLEKGSKAYNENWNDPSDPRPRSGSGSYPKYHEAADSPYRGGGGYPPEADNRRFIEQFSDSDVPMRHGSPRYDVTEPASRHTVGGYGVGQGPRKEEHDNRYQSAPYPGAQAVFPRGGGPTLQGRGTGGYSDGASSSADDDAHLGRRKDAEIANMFTNLRLQGRADGRPDNFEDTLGYLP